MKITDQVRVGTLTLENRMVMPPMATWKNGPDGIPEELVQYYADRAGKIGLITLEYVYICDDGRTRPGQLSIAHDEDIPQLARIVDAIHAKGTTKVFAQINHAGTAGGYEVGGQADIDRIRQAFVEAALRAKKIGFDGVEIHGAHGYLLNQFYSPLANKRTDAYSAATIENRTRFAREVIEAVRAAVGAEYPLSIRLGGCDYAEGGSTVADAGQAAKIYEQAGVDTISVTGGMHGYRNPYNDAPGYFSDQSEEVKGNVSIPVLLTGGITTKEDAEALLNAGKCDLIGVGRPLLQSTDLIDAFLGT